MEKREKKMRKMAFDELRFSIEPLMAHGSLFQDAARGTVPSKIPLPVNRTFLIVLRRHFEATFAK